MGKRKWDGFGSHQKIAAQRIECDICGDDRGRIYVAQICEWCHATMSGERNIADPYIGVEVGRKCDCCKLGGRRLYNTNICESCWVTGVNERRF